MHAPQNPTNKLRCRCGSRTALKTSFAASAGPVGSRHISVAVDAGPAAEAPLLAELHWRDHLRNSRGRIPPRRVTAPTRARSTGGPQLQMRRKCPPPTNVGAPAVEVHANLIARPHCAHRLGVRERRQRGNVDGGVGHWLRRFRVFRVRFHQIGGQSRALLRTGGPTKPRWRDDTSSRRGASALATARAKRRFPAALGCTRSR